MIYHYYTHIFCFPKCNKKIFSFQAIFTAKDGSAIPSFRRISPCGRNFFAVGNILIVMKYLIFCGGGSAGHVVPNLAVMSALRYSYKIAYIGTSGIERTLVQEAGFPFFTVECPKLVRKFTPKNLTVPFSLGKAVDQAAAVLEREKPDLVFSKGGFAAFPAVWAAAKAKIPALTHESDLSPGLCTKLIAKKCRYVLTSFPETAMLFPNGKHVGSPMRKELFTGDRMRALHKYGFTDGKPVLLVLGGGSGSVAINDAVRNDLGELTKRFQILHLCGKGNAIEEKSGYVEREYEKDMASAYACADVVLCRSGSNTVFEALQLKKPALFVPLEKSSRGDQLQNALYFEKKGLCRILRESRLNELVAETEKLYLDEVLRKNLSNLPLKNGTDEIISVIKNTVG